MWISEKFLGLQSASKSLEVQNGFTSLYLLEISQLTSFLNHILHILSVRI